LLTSTFKDLHIENSKNYKRWYCPHHTDCVSLAHPPKTPFRRKNHSDISYTDRVIALFVPNFVAMAMGVNRGKMRFAAFNGPSSKTPYRRKNLADIFYTSWVI